MKKINIRAVFFTMMSLMALGTIAQGYNYSQHKEMAIKKCTSFDNIAYVTAKTYSCKTPQKE